MVCPCGRQEELGTSNDNGGPRCVAATGNTVRVANVTKPIVSVEGPFPAGCTTVISKTGGCHVVTPSGQTITLH